MLLAEGSELEESFVPLLFVEGTEARAGARLSHCIAADGMLVEGLVERSIAVAVIDIIVGRRGTIASIIVSGEGVATGVGGKNLGYGGELNAFHRRIAHIRRCAIRIPGSNIYSHACCHRWHHTE